MSEAVGGGVWGIPITTHTRNYIIFFSFRVLGFILRAFTYHSQWIECYFIGIWQDRINGFGILFRIDSSIRHSEANNGQSQ